MATAINRDLGSFLRDRRVRLDPVAFGFPAGRRRTPGLRREEVAQRANISPTWYTWLEQGRGGAPSTDVLNRIAHGLMLTEAEREHMFILAFGHGPEAHYKGFEGISPRLQNVLNAMQATPAILKTVTWDVVAWNRAAAVVLTDYAKRPPARRNLLRMIFLEPGVRAKNEDWHGVARFAVSAFRADVARAGASAEIAQLVADLCQASPDFSALWQGHEVASYGEGTKRLLHPETGLIELEFSTFAVDGRTDLTLLVFTPGTAESAARIATLLKEDGEQRP